MTARMRGNRAPPTAAPAGWNVMARAWRTTRAPILMRRVRRPVSVIHIIISANRPRTDHGMQTVVDGSRIFERTAGNIVQSRGLVQLPEQQRATVGTDLRAMDFQPHPPTAPDCRNRALYHPFRLHPAGDP